jgi:cyclic dehypoxanthinyl futalosine synthase
LNDFAPKHYLCINGEDNAFLQYMSGSDKLLRKVYDGQRLSLSEGVALYKETPLSSLLFLADELRKRLHPAGEVGWMIDRNVNITNICFSQCRFCNFCRRSTDEDAYVTTDAQYDSKIKELFDLGGNQLLLQGGMNPSLGLDFYISLFSSLKERWPALKLHALGPPEIVFLAHKENASIKKVLTELLAAGLDSLPGAGAEILVDRVRKSVSPAKATTEEWLDVMREAHRLNIPTSATMMFGHAETIEERVEHLVRLRQVQDEKPEGNYGFITFIPWPFRDQGTVLADKYGIKNTTTAADYLRVIAISRIMLDNIPNLQSSILTVGKETASITLHSGANDLGSIMIEENVVSAAGKAFRFGPEEMQQIIMDAGFTPVRRDQLYRRVQ